MWKDYPVPGGTLRENLYSKPGQKTVLETHPAARFHYTELLETNGDGKGGILIDRVNGDIPVTNGIEKANGIEKFHGIVKADEIEKAVADSSTADPKPVTV